jgi:glycosyltransferase involved in cell wall biosynthesis
MKISYAVTVCNEVEEIKRIIAFLLKHKREQDQILVLMDLQKSDFYDKIPEKEQVHEFIMQHHAKAHLQVAFRSLNNDFAAFKNNIASYCTGDYIFQIDADELPHEKLIEILPDLLEENCDCDVFLVPRVNTVEGMQQDHMQQWGWAVNEKGWINWPDNQWRIWKNKPEIKWINKVHERLDGFKSYTVLPEMEEFALYHPKTIERQIKQNNYYSTL